jgi:hypothetical protein
MVFEALFIVPQFIPDMDEVTRDVLQVGRLYERETAAFVWPRVLG